MSKIAVIGTGYVGLTTGVCFAHLGHEVICADIDPEKVDALSRGEVPILEADIDRLLAEARQAGRIRFVLGATNAAAECEFAYLCVPTPQGDDGSADLSYVEAAAREIGPVLPTGAVVVNKSTVPVGSTRVVERALGRSDISVVSNPEFLREGSAVSDFLNPDRVVIGSDHQDAAIRVASLYVGVPAPLMVTDPASAETIKYAANAFLATKLSFVNGIAAVCEAVGADVNDVVLGMGYDQRIGREFLRPGPGWGGSCFPKDTRALARIAEDAGYDFKFLRGVLDLNDEQFERVAAKVCDMVGESIEGRKIAAWGLTFKANTDDLRDSPAIEVLKRLSEQGASIRAFDPAVHGPVAELPGVEVVADPFLAVDDAEVLVVLTEWDEFKWVDLDKVADLMRRRQVLDARNLLDRSMLVRRGFNYRGIGRS
ncbi:MAG: UDP-glucose/GDP-mannose dehydrogenase family protein [Actinomycetia bacterium]|nr:UDP-glucose/GDP-mannose dehydrogenase family protein [Actinomycetes bacterium]MCP3912271.1 UDP-glucose/GDP-mannose dehydrogenase family protein [Actinomycetes bacterium]MCP4087998.1 UDP-glucose/GDP-mannose dehydrogenase family protein [Actinomycetes bacterium]